MVFIDYELKHISAIYKPKRVLDIGAGELNQSLELAREGIEVDAIEPSFQQNIELPPNLHIYVTTAEQFEYPENTYDLIVFRMVAQRLQNAFVKNLFETTFLKTLRDKGIIYFVIPANYNIPTKLENFYTICGTHKFEVPTSDFKIIQSFILQKR